MSIQRSGGQRPRGRQDKETRPVAEENAAPVPLAEDRDELVAPPRPGKVHPRDNMDEATPTLDDEARHYRHHPNDAGATSFGFDPEAADAAADLAGELGAAFLEGATRGEDMSDVVAERGDRDEDDLPLLLDEEGEEVVDEDTPTPHPHAVRARPFEEPGALGQSSAREARPDSAVMRTRGARKSARR